MKLYTILPMPKGATVAFADVEIHLPSPARMITLLMSPSTDSHLYLHQMPLSKSAASSPLATTGTESWIPMQGTQRNFPTIVFDKPIDKFYISGDSGASGQIPTFCLLVADGIFSLEGVAGQSTIVNPLPVQIIGTAEVVEQGAAKANGNQVTVAATTTVVAAANATRRGISITQLANGTDIYIGVGTAATLAAGDLLPGVKGAWVFIATTLAVNAITLTGTAGVSFLEIYD